MPVTIQQPQTKPIINQWQLQQLTNLMFGSNCQVVPFSFTNRDVQVRNSARDFAANCYLAGVFGVLPLGYFISTRYRHIQSKMLLGTAFVAVMVCSFGEGTGRIMIDRHLKTKFHVDYDLPVYKMYQRDYKIQDFRNKKPEWE